MKPKLVHVESVAVKRICPATIAAVITYIICERSVTRNMCIYSRTGMIAESVSDCLQLRN